MTVNIFDLTDTWNDSGTVFNFLKVNVTNTASAAASALMDLQIGGSTLFKITKDGNIVLGAGTKSITGVGNFMLDTTVHFASTSTSNSRVAIASNVDLRSSAAVNWSSTAAAVGTKDAGLVRKAAGVVKASDGSSGDGAIAASYLELLERSLDPSNPAEGEAVLWMSDGTGSGDDGDLMVKITAGGTTKTATLVDFSTV